MRPIYLLSLTPYPGVTHLPLLATRTLRPKIDFARYDLIIATSKQVFKALDAIDTGWKQIPVLAVSPKTADAAVAAGAHVVDTGDGYGETLYTLINAKYVDKKLLYPRPKVKASDFTDRLRREGVAVDDVIVYETLCDEKAAECNIPEDAILVFTSPSAVQCYKRVRHFHASQALIAIGSTTAAAFEPEERVHLPKTPTVRHAIELAKSLQEGSG
jgi:uroporphyrinogen-III synthase